MDGGSTLYFQNVNLPAAVIFCNSSKSPVNNELTLNLTRRAHRRTDVDMGEQSREWVQLVSIIKNKK
jgi:hypothetical protein